MSDLEDEVPESPSTWENIVVGEVKKVAGRALRDGELAAEGEEQMDAAHEVREEYEEEHRS